MPYSEKGGRLAVNSWDERVDGTGYKGRLGIRAGEVMPFSGRSSRGQAKVMQKHQRGFATPTRLFVFKTPVGSP